MSSFQVAGDALLGLLWLSFFVRAVVVTNAGLNTCQVPQCQLTGGSGFLCCQVGCEDVMCSFLPRSPPTTLPQLKFYLGASFILWVNEHAGVNVVFVILHRLSLTSSLTLSPIS